MKFVDEVSIELSSGKGGPGAVSFSRESMTPRGGPDGGDGGRGGNVVIKATPQLNTLVEFRFKKKFEAPNGNPGERRNMSGADGEDLVLLVPVGTLIKDSDGNTVADLSEPTELILLKGGRGGKGNTFFKTSVNQAPEYAQPGEPAQHMQVSLELKLLADVGVIGYPNAGKSTLISRISAAKPKIADYPFTTLFPNLGVVKLGEFKSFVVADIPGLVPGAHEGVGLGTQFLRHIERTNLFIHLIDASGLSGRDPLQDYDDINHELKAHDEVNSEKDGYRVLSDRKQMVVLNKIDSISHEERDQLVSRFKKRGIEVRSISAVTGQGIKELVHELGRVVFGEEKR